MNPSHHGSDEQMFGAKQQVPHEARNDEEVEPPMRRVSGCLSGRHGGR